MLTALEPMYAYRFYGVYKERPAVFKKYIILNAILVLITLIYSMGVIVISSTRHNTAIEQCLLQFVSNDDLKATTSASGRTVCNIWTWAQLGICGFLWALFAGSEIYFCLSESRSAVQKQKNLAVAADTRLFAPSPLSSGA